MLSPPFRPSPSPTSCASPGPASGPLPDLPFEVIRRILHFRLALTPSYPPPVSSGSSSGAKAKSADVARRKERGEVMRAAKALMGVCKAWKPIVLKYLYAEPHITSNLPSLARSILLGDSKWSDINLHAFSLPGRYLTTLDLSLLSSVDLHPISIRRACLSIFPLLPNVTHLKLPEGRLPFALEEIGWSAFAHRLKCLEGVVVDSELDGQGRDALIELLRRAPNIEILGVYGPTHPHPQRQQEIVPSPPLQLEHLHTLKLENIKNGRFITSLLTAELPSLRHLQLTSYYLEADDQTFALQEHLGPNLLSLTYLPAQWPARATSTVPPQTLELHPNLVHLSYLLPDDFEQLLLILDSCESGSSDLKSLTVSKGSDILSANATFQRNLSSLQRLFEHLLDTSPPPPVSPTGTPPVNPILSASTVQAQAQAQSGVKSITIDGFRWVRADLGRAAMLAGSNGEMRNWSIKLLKRGIELKDMDGHSAPKEMVGPLCVSGGGFGMGMGMAQGQGQGYGGRRRSSGGSTAGVGWGMLAALAEKEKEKERGSVSPDENGTEDDDGG